MRRSPESASLSETAKRAALSCRRAHRVAAVGTLLGLLFAGVAAAQNANFVTPGTSNRTNGIPEKARLLNRVEEAPWTRAWTNRSTRAGLLVLATRTEMRSTGGILLLSVVVVVVVVVRRSCCRRNVVLVVVMIQASAV